jgi:thioredoxin-related protein
MSRAVIFSIAVVLYFSTSLVAGNNSDNSNQAETINWVSMEEAERLSKQNPKKIFVDIYTDWCGWCKRMEAVTFTHPDIVNYINKNYYAVKLNAEQTEAITFRGQQYINENPATRRSTHNLARAILQGRMSYPSVAFFDEELNLITAIPGYREPKQFEPILVFFKDNHFLTQPNLEEFIKDFKGTIQ